MPITDPPLPAPPPISRGDERASRRAFLSGITILVLTATFFIIQYDRSRLMESNLETWYQPKAAGVLSEVDQYRIGIAYLAHFLEVHTPLAMRQSVPLIESISYGVGITCLYLLLIRS